MKAWAELIGCVLALAILVPIVAAAARVWFIWVSAMIGWLL